MDIKELCFSAANDARSLTLLPSEVFELIDRLEEAEKSDAESIAMYRNARDERDTLRAKIEAMEKKNERP